jgi:predicted O-methyltransferase YrrM
MNTYRATSETPALVSRALALAAGSGFTASCLPEVGRLLATLAAGVRGGAIGEVGAGCGVGTAWMVGALAPGVSLITVERDPAQAAAVVALLADHPAARVLHADWRAILPHGLFALLFADTPAKHEEPEALLGALALGGTIVLDDLTPEEGWPAAWRGRRDSVRDFWLNDPRLIATEIRTTATTAAILATRMG